jgi:hypothetical protein
MSAFDVDADGTVDLLAGNTWFRHAGGGRFEAVQIALDREMAKLGILPALASKRAAESVKGKWSTGDVTMLVTIMKRNFDIGLGDGMVTPTLVPNVPECPNAEPLSSMKDWMDSAVPRVDRWGNIYLVDGVKPPDRSYPEFFDGKLPQKGPRPATSTGAARCTPAS